MKHFARPSEKRSIQERPTSRGGAVDRGSAAHGVTEMSTLTLRLSNDGADRTLARRIWAAGRAFRVYREHVLATRSLEAMDNHLLKDIGISRPEIGWAVYGLGAEI
jgi:uncharacterized protein YjiS (DUF1127 family)